MDKDEGTFEEKMARLEEIVKMLESPDIALETGMRLYREGAVCAKFCREKLEQAKHELQIWQGGDGVNVSSIEELDGLADESEEDA